jgi:hypothetical protein
LDMRAAFLSPSAGGLRFSYTTLNREAARCGNLRISELLARLCSLPEVAFAE